MTRVHAVSTTRQLYALALASVPASGGRMMAIITKSSQLLLETRQAPKNLWLSVAETDAGEETNDLLSAAHILFRKVHSLQVPSRVHSPQVRSPHRVAVPSILRVYYIKKALHCVGCLVLFGPTVIKYSFMLKSQTHVHITTHKWWSISNRLQLLHPIVQG